MNGSNTHRPSPVDDVAEQRARVLAHMERRERIALETAAKLEAAHSHDTVDPLAGIDASVRREAEEAFHLERGRHRYITSDGRELFLTQEEIDRRKQLKKSGRHKRNKGHNYGMQTADSGRWWITWGFNIGAVLLALVMVYVILS